MTAEVRDDAGPGGLARGMGFGRGGGLDSLAARREAAQRRLSSTVRATELVDCGLRRFDEALAEHGSVDHDGSLRPTVRALLGLAYGTVDYDMTLLPASSDVAVRVRYTTFGPEAEVVDLALGEQETWPPVAGPAGATTGALTALPHPAPGTVATPAPGADASPVAPTSSLVQPPPVQAAPPVPASPEVAAFPAVQPSPSEPPTQPTEPPTEPPTDRAEDTRAAEEHARATPQPASPWWTPGTRSR